MKTQAGIALSIGLAMASGCARSGKCGVADARDEVAVHHVVLFKLHDPSQAGALLADCRRLLPGIPGVVSYYGGQHVATGRSGIEAGYDAAIGVGFESLEAYSVYVTHPDHVSLVSTWRPRLDWLRIYDISGSEAALTAHPRP